MPRLALLPDAALPADFLAQIEELSPAHPALAENFDLFDPRRVQWKRPLDADAVRDPADGEGRAQPAAPASDHGPLEGLQPVPAALGDLHVDPHGVPRRKRRQLRLHLLAFDRDESLHDATAPRRGCDSAL